MEKDETMVLVLTEGVRKCMRELLFTGSLLQWRPLSHK